MPAMLRAIVGDLLEAQPDMLLVGQPDVERDVLRSACEEHADVLIAEEPDAADHSCLQALLSSGSISIFTLSSKGLGPAAVRLVEGAPFELGDGLSLIDAIRDARSRASPMGCAAIPTSLGGKADGA
jgi:hypothetical protein